MIIELFIAGRGERKQGLARIFHELLSRDHEDGCATWQPQGDGSEAYLNGTSQGELVLILSKEHPRTPGRTAILFALAALRSVPQAGSQFRGRSHARA